MGKVRRQGGDWRDESISGRGLAKDYTPLGRPTGAAIREAPVPFHSFRGRQWRPSPPEAAKSPG